MKFYENCKRIFQSLDLRFNRIYNVKTPNLTDDSDGEEVSNKNYVDENTTFKSTRNSNFDTEFNSGDKSSLNEVLDYVLHDKLSDANNFKLPEFTGMSLFVTNVNKSISNKFYLFKNTEYRLTIYGTFINNEFISNNKPTLIINSGLTQNRLNFEGEQHQWVAFKQNIDFERGDDYVVEKIYNDSVSKKHHDSTIKYNPLPYVLDVSVRDFIFGQIELCDSIYIRVLDDSVIQDDLNSLKLSKNANDYLRYDSVNFAENKITSVPNKYLIFDIAIPKSMYSNYDLHYSKHYNEDDYQVIEGKINLSSCLHAFPNETVQLGSAEYKVFRWNFGISEKTSYIILNPADKFNPKQI